MTTDQTKKCRKTLCTSEVLTSNGQRLCHFHAQGVWNLHYSQSPFTFVESYEDLASGRTQWNLKWIEK